MTGFERKMEDMRGYDGTNYVGLGGKSWFEGDISNWDTSRVRNMDYMFLLATKFNGDISSWDVSAVTSMKHMFDVCYVFNQDIGSWDTSQVTDMSSLFRCAYAFNKDISGWTGKASTSHQEGMFDSATAFQAKFKCTDAITGPASSCVPKN